MIFKLCHGLSVLFMSFVALEACFGFVLVKGEHHRLPCVKCQAPTLQKNYFRKVKIPCLWKFFSYFFKYIISFQCIFSKKKIILFQINFFVCSKSKLHKYGIKWHWIYLVVSEG